MRKIVLATIGTSGDLNPFIAIAVALQHRGFAPVLAVPEDQVEKCALAGVSAIPMLPGLDAIYAGMGLSRDEAVRRIMSNQRVMFEQVLLPNVASAVAALEEAVGDAEAIVASIFVLAAPIVAEKCAVPLVSVILQPMAMLSAYDPPHTPDFWMMAGAPVGRWGAGWNRLSYSILRWVMNRLYGRRINRLRIDQGLPAIGARTLLEPPTSALLRLGCYSPVLAPLPEDAAENTRITGFPIFDSGDGRCEALHPMMAAFLDAGPPPLVFTLGTFAVNGPGRFYDRAEVVARRLGMRAILLVGGTSPPTIDGDILRCGYAPFSQLLSSAAIIIHHGGVGTTGQALRAGKPQLVVPHMGDQHDHAHRVTMMGVGRRLTADDFSIRRATRDIAALLGDPSYRDAAERVAHRMAEEQGAEAAAVAIEQALDARAEATP